MADMFSTLKRSEIMSHVRSSGNKATEIRLMALFRRHRITGWRRHARLFGNPDFIFLKQRLAIFVDGCFWHGCPTHASQPKSNEAFWKSKLARNRDRDRLVARTLKRHGWRVFRVWQHEFSRKNDHKLARRILRAVRIPKKG